MRKLLMVLVLLTGCGPEQVPGPDSGEAAHALKPAVYAVNYPLAWMAQQLVGEGARVVFPAPEGIDPAFWEPDITTLTQYQQADLLLLNGAGYAKWTATVSLPARIQVDTSTAYRDQLLAAVGDPVHSHGPGGEHSHGELAFTTWLDLQLAQSQSQAVAESLQRLLPADAMHISNRQAALEETLGALDARLAALGQQLEQRPILYSHPVYQYLQRRYGLNGLALHWEPDQLPTPAQWAELDSTLQSHPAQLMLWEAQPLPEVVTRLQQRGVAVVVFSTLGNRPAEGDFATGMAANISALESALE